MDTGHDSAANQRSVLIPLTVAMLVVLSSAVLADGPD